MRANPRIPVDIPSDLNEVVLRGIEQGKKVAAHRRRVKRAVTRSMCSFVLAAGLLVGGIHLSPAFAAAVENVPILGQLVQIFGRNQPVIEGGVGANSGKAAVTMERDGDTEQIRLDFGQADASLYRAEFASYPKTITITLPGTASVEVLSEITRAQDTSQYIKSVYEVPIGMPETTVLQLELESDADVQVEEYRDPGSLVIRLLPTEIQMDTIYSVRTLSVSGQALQALTEQYAGQETRILQDDSGNFFVELAQYDTREAAEDAVSGELIVEERTGNNVPVCFETMEQYQNSEFLNEYNQLLLTSAAAEPVLAFVEAHIAGANSEEQDILLSGLYGFLQDTDEDLDWSRVASIYQAAQQEIPAYVQQHLN